jgi:hypothetical protein
VQFMRGLLVLICMSMPAAACGPEVRISFSEASPDQFRITFVRGAKMSIKSVTINLTGSAAGVIFDDQSGLDIQGLQPDAQGVSIRAIKYRTSKEETSILTFYGFLEARTVVFHSDLDDTGQSADPDQNHLADGELEGATATARLVSDQGRKIDIHGRFDKKGKARLGDRACV